MVERAERIQRRWSNLLCALPLALGIAMIAYALSTPAPRAGSLTGRWRRPDGGYVLEIGSIAANGEARARYFNPDPIHVARARVEDIVEAKGIYVELRDEGYPGNFYRLRYEADCDRLSGTYDQPEARRQFEVYFERWR